MMPQSQNFETTYTKIYVAGLPWSTRNDGLRSYFQQFGEIVHANVVCDRSTDRSQGFGFVTFRDAESATRACANPNPIIEGRTASCKLASDGRDVNQNQSNLTGLRNDDLCYLSQCFMQQHANYHQPYPTNVEPYWNQYYQQYNPQSHYVPQGVYLPYVPQRVYSPYVPQRVYRPHAPQGVYRPYAPQGIYLPHGPQGIYLPYGPQRVYPSHAPQGYYQYYTVANTTTTYRQHRSMNVPEESQDASQSSNSSSLSSTQESSLE